MTRLERRRERLCIYSCVCTALGVGAGGLTVLCRERERSGRGGERTDYCTRNFIPTARTLSHRTCARGRAVAGKRMGERLGRRAGGGSPLVVACRHVSVPHTLTISLLVNELAQHGHTFTQQALANRESESMEACELDVKAPHPSCASLCFVNQPAFSFTKWLVPFRRCRSSVIGTQNNPQQMHPESLRLSCAVAVFCVQKIPNGHRMAMHALAAHIAHSHTPRFLRRQQSASRTPGQTLSLHAGASAAASSMQNQQMQQAPIQIPSRSFVGISSASTITF